MESKYIDAIKVIRVRSLLSEAILSIHIDSDDRELQIKILDAARRSNDVIEHIAEAIIEGRINNQTLIQDLNSAKYLLELFENELLNVRLNIPTFNEIDDLIDNLSVVQ
uniref:hypothetical protein n=1 Tax=Serratia entomophila TaxID=42906 RepID=UPI001F4C1B22|nr:hypothetical protein [Serratia entomophila]ULG11312.1 hypothetical protein 345p3_00023 [Serratia entomophila]ULG11339.1 hypothetical protein 345p3_00050 [Serratia entomophila]